MATLVLGAALAACVDAMDGGVRAQDGAPHTADTGTADSGLSPAARCGLGDIDWDDSTGYIDDWVPDHVTLPGPLPDRPARCGDDRETLVWRLANCERAARGLQPLACDLRLVWAGRTHALDMADRQELAHRTEDGASHVDRLDALGIDFSWSGENLALHNSVWLAHRAWMESPLHADNVLHPHYTHMGAGVVRGPDDRLWSTVLFLSP
jgi:hypothetical protein